MPYQKCLKDTMYLHYVPQTQSYWYMTKEHCIKQLVTGPTLLYPLNTLGSPRCQGVCGPASVSYRATAMHAKMFLDGRI